MTRYQKYKLYYLYKYFLKKTAPLLMLLAVFHIIYFILNLTEILPVALEKWVLFFYPLWVIFYLLYAGYGLARANSNFPVYLENNFQLNFRLINIYENKKNMALEKFIKERDRILNLITTACFKAKTGLYLTKYFFLFFFLICVFHFILPGLSRRFITNIKFITGSKYRAAIEFKVPSVVNEGENAEVYYKSAMGPAQISWHSRGEYNTVSLRPAASFLISNVVAPLQIEMRVTKGRYKKKMVKKVKVNEKPAVENIYLKVKEPVLQTWQQFEGITAITVLQGATVNAVVEIQEGQRIKDIRLTGKKPASVNRSYRANKAKLGFKARQNYNFDLSVINKHNLSSASPVGFSLTVKHNEKPSVTIVDPPGNIEVDEASPLPVNFKARDDVMLKALKLYIKVIPVYDRESIQATNIAYNFNRKQGYVRQIIDVINLPLDQLDFLPGYKVRYFLSAVDYNGLQGFSRTNLVNYMTLSRIYSKKQQKTAELANTLSRQQQSARELKKEFEKLKIMKERGELQRQHLKEYKEKLKKFKKDVASGLEKTESFKEHKQKPELFFSAEVKEKLGLIQKELKKIDREFLQSLQTEMEDILKEVEFNKKDVTDFLQKFEMEDLHKSLDNVYQSVKQLQKLQQFDALEKMAAALYEKYEDVRATAISKNDHDFFNKEKRKIENDLQSLTEHYNKLRPDMNFSDKESKKLLADLDRDLDSSSLQDFKNFNLKNDNFQPAQRFADKFGKIKKNISLLTRRMKNMDIGKAVTEINKQLAGFTVHIKWNNDLSRGHVYDLEDIYNNTLNKLYADYLSGLNTVTLRSKEHLYDLLAGYIPGFLDFLKTYDRLVLNNRKLLQKLDPALNYKAVDAYRIRENAGLVVLRYNRLVYDLLNLKKMLLKQQQQNSMQNSFNKALSKQQSLNQRLRQMMQQGKLSSQMMEYIKQSAMQQAMIRSMLEQMQKGQGKPKPSGKPGGRQSRTPGADQTLKQIIEEMKKLEGDLKKFKKNDTQRIIKKQRKIEEKLLQYNKGLKEKRQKNKKKERKAESAARQFVGSEEQIKEKYKNLIKQLQELQKSENYPKEYEERIQRYLHKLNQLQKQ